ncbi:MAG: Nif3-like dinuclear metal center hexameric protein, partial [Candidatus Methanoperedens sp.]
MNLRELIPILESIAPPELAEDFDTGRIGLVLDRAADVRRIAVALDPTDYVLKKAARLGVNLLITHHTLIFDP